MKLKNLCVLIALTFLVQPLAVVCQGTSASFPTGGAIVQAVFFRGVGEGELPTLILLHGFPGGEGDVLGLGERISSGSFNVLTFNFRGVRKSEGTFTFGNSISDVAAAVDYLKRGNISGVDRDRIGVLGWSFGAWVAMMAGAENPEIQCVGARFIDRQAQELWHRPDNPAQVSQTDRERSCLSDGAMEE